MIDLLFAHLALSDRAALVFFALTLPVCIWVAASDVKHMKIRNMAVLALLVIYGVTGPLVLPLQDYLWGWVHFAVVLVICFGANMVGIMGAGDAKFLAAAAPFVPLSDSTEALYILVVAAVVALVLHRAIRRIPAVTRALPGWESWTNSKFPMGLALGPALSAYLAAAAFV
ncbi:Type IV leader peptidase family protein [Rhodobacteraceae bacterium THAF1]|uniref:A24 family peptidase n=1 Tax=Palleronia sp. THAF1 TaxID=2587842 RepID=UPI000F3C6AF2|nr:prepilin peptidase [Palleronia sp. THAF1]QFU07399.1 Type IV leader peptidase family protein [Palleronia sp. THAF1]VDC20689.1 Type IV leader peptidase family protein [Rhodobacteraceae bacterium THAF1]